MEGKSLDDPMCMSYIVQLLGEDDTGDEGKMTQGAFDTLYCDEGKMSHA